MDEGLEGMLHSRSHVIQDAKSEGALHVLSPYPSTFVFQGSFAQVNATAVPLDENSVLLFDTLTFPEEGRRIRRYLAERRLSVRTVVYSHPDLDHLANGYQFRSASVLVHRDAWIELRKGGAGLSRSLRNQYPALKRVDPPLRMADVAFEKQCIMSYGGPVVELHAAPGHRGGSLVAWMPSSRLLLAGDAVMGAGRLPSLHAPEQGGDIDALIETLRTLAALDPETVVPGHGAPGGPELIQRNLDYLHRLRRAIHGRRGVSLPQAFEECSEDVLALPRCIRPRQQLLDAHKANFVHAWTTLTPWPLRAAASM